MSYFNPPKWRLKLRRFKLLSDLKAAYLTNCLYNSDFQLLFFRKCLTWTRRFPRRRIWLVGLPPAMKWPITVLSFTITMPVRLRYVFIGWFIKKWPITVLSFPITMPVELRYIFIGWLICHLLWSIQSQWIFVRSFVKICGFTITSERVYWLSFCHLY